MKKNHVTALILLSLALFACQNKTETEQIDTIPDDRIVTVCLLTDAGGVDGKSFGASAWRGILDFYGDNPADQKQRGSVYDLVTAQDQDLFVPHLRQVTDEGYDLIINTGFDWASALRIVASDNPHQKYLLVDVDFIQLPNVMQAVYAEHEGSYLVGAAAALKAREDGIVNPRFGFIGGVAGSNVIKVEIGYVQGILSVIPNAQIIDFYVNSFGEPALAKTQAKNWYDSGVYAIFSAAGEIGNGIIAQAKEYRAEGKNVWALGVDSDMFEEGIYNDAGDSAVLTSMIKRVENGALYALNAVNNNTFSGEVINFDLSSDGVGYSTANPALSGSIIEQLEIVKERIVSGQIKVAGTLVDAVLIPGFSHNLRAVDD